MVSRAIHFSHHACGGPRLYDDTTRDRWRSAYGDDAVANRPYVGCRAARPHGRATVLTPRVFSTDPSRVTCKACRKQIDNGLCFTNGLYNSSAPITDHHEMIKRAWITCCSHKGAAWPLSREDLVQHEREQIDDAISTHWNGIYAATCPRDGKTAELIGHDGVAERMRSRCAAFAERLTEMRLLEAARPAIAEVLLAAEWLDQVEAALTRADVLFEELRDRIDAGERFDDVRADDRLDSEDEGAEGDQEKHVADDVGPEHERAHRPTAEMVA